MRVLVTGASGFIGSHVAEQLVEQGHEVRVLVRKTSDRSFLLSLPKIEFADGSVEDQDAVNRAVDGVDAIIHSAGLVKAKRPEDFIATNVDGTRHLLQAALDRRTQIRRFVFVSSLTASGPSHDGQPISEDVPPGPVTAYGRSKLESERIVAEAKGELPVTIIRPPAVYGPRDHEMLTFFDAISKGVFPVLGGGTQRLSMIYGADAASSCILPLTVEHESGKAYFIEDGEIYTLPMMIDLAQEVMGKKPVRINVPFGLLRAVSYGSQLWGKLTDKAVMLTPDKVNELAAPHWVCSSAAIRKDLGWSSKVKFGEGARLTAAWYREHNWIR